MKAGIHYYIYYEPGKIIKFYNDEKTIDLSLSMENKTEDYYLFSDLYYL